ncbi:response regulator transcription factor [Sulfurimonas sp. SAG-AH-194-C20]|nr:response regulator transcription factor [Sulfurimonas sp. SAG-AH-194-C20]MDF1878912.1 response regulator transcription factor [Sulfurimonas sp. SAG-AH-194-C20]
MKILLLEDELMLQESIEEFLISKGYSVDSFDNSDDAFDAIFSKNYDLLLLDVNVPGEWDGFALRKELAKEEKDIPTIFVTSMSSADAMLRGYATGCCDYIKKPFDLIELLLRVQHALKANCFHTESDLIELCPEYYYNTINYSLIHNSKEIPLSKTERSLLKLFVVQKNQIVSLDMIYEEIWENNIEAGNARVQINNLRRKLPKDLIRNIYGLGYRYDS